VDIGKAYFFRAGSALDDLADLTWTGEGSEDRFGKAVAGGFDWNADGAADCAVGAYTSDHNTDLDAGACFVFFGGAMLDGMADTVLTGSGPDAAWNRRPQGWTGSGSTYGTDPSKRRQGAVGWGENTSCSIAWAETGRHGKALLHGRASSILVKKFFAFSQTKKILPRL